MTRPRLGVTGGRGDTWIWFTGSALGLCLLMIVGLVGVVLVNGLGFFWPERLVKVTLKDGGVFLGQVVDVEPIPRPGTPEHNKKQRLQLKVGNRDLLGYDFKWIDEDEIVSRERPADVVYVERREYGPLLGTPARVTDQGRVVAEGSEAAWTAVQPYLARARRDRAALREIERDQIGEINYRIEQARLGQRKLELEQARRPQADLAARRAELERRIAEQQALYQAKQEELQKLVETTSQSYLTVTTPDGQEKELRTLDVFRAFRPNRLSAWGRTQVYAGRLWEFVSGDPRESNTEGGIFPAIFGTVMMVMIMSLMAVPFGVLAALYLREYARQGALVRTVRIAVNNLAGVPSIVFGVFGLGFFVYVVGGSIDRAFFPEALPTPTFGTGGILWASLTLALLTVPVVIVAAEEALAAVPRSMREASLAAGATKWQTIQRVVLPAAAPGILTGLILAMARGAGEVAPLMITGVVKLAPDLPLDGFFPFVHLDRKFMHLGFHIYDVGFQSPNVEAAKPMVYTTTILLLAIVVLLNLTAIVVRNRLREEVQDFGLLRDDMATPAGTADQGLRIKTEVRAPEGRAGTGRTAIELKTVNLSYGDNHVLHDISMDIGEKMVTAFIGPSGCGKSTLLRCLNRMNDLIDNTRITGTIRVEGADIYAAKTDVIDVRRRIGMVFQKSNPFPKSIYENVVYGLRIAGIRDKATLDDAAERSLRGAALWEEVKDRLGESGLSLSGGQQQRLCIARAIAVEPEIVLMDEPCSALDPIATVKIEELMYGLKEHYTIVIVTHNLQQAARVSDKTAFFWLGRLVEYGETSAMFTNPREKLTEDYITGRFG